MSLVFNWQDILKKAWSVRFGVASIFFSIADAMVPFFATYVPDYMLSLLAVACSIGVVVSRVMYQKSLPDG